MPDLIILSFGLQFFQNSLLKYIFTSHLSDTLIRRIQHQCYHCNLVISYRLMVTFFPNCLTFAIGFILIDFFFFRHLLHFCVYYFPRNDLSSWTTQCSTPSREKFRAEVIFLLLSHGYHYQIERKRICPKMTKKLL